MTKDMQEPPPAGELWPEFVDVEPSWLSTRIEDLTPTQFHDVIGIVAMVAFLVALVLLQIAFG